MFTGVAFVNELKNLSNVYKYLTLSRDSLAASVILLSYLCLLIKFLLSFKFQYLLILSTNLMISI
jgi:hypothetical protein